MATKKKDSSVNITKKRTPVHLTYFRHSLHIDEKEAERFAYRMIDYIRRTKSCYKISHFLQAVGIGRSTFYEWVKKFEVVRAAKELCDQIIATRREIGGLEGTLNAGMVMSTMAMFDPDYKEHFEWKAMITAQAQQKDTGGLVVVEIEPMANSPMVPKRNADE